MGGRVGSEDGAWPDPRRRARHALEDPEAAPRSAVRRRFRALTTVLSAVGWPSLFIVGVSLPDRLEGPRALVLASALSLFVFERLVEARVRREQRDFEAFARALDAEDAFASTVFVLSESPRAKLGCELPPPPPPHVWRSRAARRAEVPNKRAPWPPLPPPVVTPSERTTAQPATVMRLPISQRPTVPESMRTIHVDLIEKSRQRDG